MHIFATDVGIVVTYMTEASTQPTTSVFPLVSLLFSPPCFFAFFISVSTLFLFPP